MQPIRAYCTNQSLVGYLAVLLVATPAILVVAGFAVAIGCVGDGIGLSHRTQPAQPRPQSRRHCQQYVLLSAIP